MTFIQFYENNQYEIFLRNSFSSVWNNIKNLGDIIWVNPFQETFIDVLSPVYISCSFEHEIGYIKKWIENRPDLQFIIGGPAIIYMKLFLSYPNVFLDSRQMYDVLNITPTEDMWGLSLPPIKMYNKIIFYIYSLSFGNKCYWGKCSFCRTEEAKMFDLNVTRIPILKPNKNRIWLNKQALEPKDIRRLFPTLQNDSIYSYYLRGDGGVANALKSVSIVETHRPIIGVEFPSDRMLKIMNKGLTVDELLKTILIYLEKDCGIILTTIHGWNDLTNDDVEKVEWFLNKIEKFKHKINCVDHLLFFHGRSDSEIQCSTKYNKLYYIYNLNEEQTLLNNKVMDLYKSFGFANYSDNSDVKRQGVEMYKQKSNEEQAFYE